MVALSREVTVVVIMFCPTNSGIAPDAVPEVTATPFTDITDVESLAVGVIKTEVTPNFSLTE